MTNCCFIYMLKTRIFFRFLKLGAKEGRREVLTWLIPPAYRGHILL